MFGIKLENENPFHEAHRRENERAAYMERIEALKSERAKAYQDGIDDTLAELEIGDRARYYKED